MNVTYVDSAQLSPASGRTSVAIPIPVTPANAANDIAIVGIYKENGAAVTPPAGWTLKASETTNATTQGALFIFWKRLAAPESGTYDFSWIGAVYAGAEIFMARGCVETGDPFHDFTILRTPNNAGAVISAEVASVNEAMGLSFISSWAFAPRTFTAPAGWTRAEQNAVGAVGYKEGLSAGTTGSISWTGSGNDYYQMFLGTLKPVVVAPTGPTLSVIASGVKKPATAYVISGGAKKVATPYVISGGVRK